MVLAWKGINLWQWQPLQQGGQIVSRQESFLGAAKMIPWVYFVHWRKDQEKMLTVVALAEQHRAQVRTTGFSFSSVSLLRILNFQTRLHKLVVSYTSRIYQNNTTIASFCYALCYLLPYTCHIKILTNAVFKNHPIKPTTCRTPCRSLEVLSASAQRRAGGDGRVAEPSKTGYN